MLVFLNCSIKHLQNQPVKKPFETLDIINWKCRQMEEKFHILRKTTRILSNNWHTFCDEVIDISPALHIQTDRIRR